MLKKILSLVYCGLFFNVSLDFKDIFLNFSQNKIKSIFHSNNLLAYGKKNNDLKFDFSYNLSKRQDDVDLRTNNYYVMASSGNNKHKVLSGENLYTIAKKYKTSVQKIIKLNDLRNDAHISIGQELLIPDTKGRLTKDDQDDVILLKKNNQSETTLKNKESKLDLNQKNKTQMDVEKNDKKSDEQSTQTIYTVKSGDSLYKISRLFDVSENKIKLDNKLTSNSIRIGQKLTINSKVYDEENNSESKKSTLSKNDSSHVPFDPKILNSVNYDAISMLTSDEDPKCGFAAGAGNFMIPLEGNVIASFDDHYQGFKEDTITIESKSTKSPIVKCSKDGVVKAHGRSTPGYGNFIVVKHDSNLISIYAHLQEVFVKEDQSVKTGQPLGRLDKDISDSYRLLFAVRSGRKAINPLFCFKKNIA